jgi:Fe-Mn family superoxide dismutase
MLQRVSSLMSRSNVRSVYNLPALPYEYNALEPVISAQIMTLHHNKHHAAYVANLNKLLSAPPKSIDDNIKQQAAIKFNGGGHINHSILWTNLSPKNKYGGQELNSGISVRQKLLYNIRNT